MGLPVLVCAIGALGGLAIMAAVVIRSRRLAPDFGEFFAGLDYGDIDEADPSGQGLAEPLVSRTVGAVARALAARLERLLPTRYVEALGRRLDHAGLGGKRAVGHQLALQLGLGLVGLALAPFVASGSSSRTVVLAFVGLPIMGFMAPGARLKRAASMRSNQIFKDLPDIVDMLAIAVEAGSGFEAALQVVCSNFKSPLTDELSRALHEMELGLPRREALQQLRDRVDLDVVRTLMLALLQADALGIPIGRVLKSQANEVRARRRAWAREKAAKLPVKIMFPLVLFIFPPIMALVLAPAGLTFSQLAS
jgi:tight adherence protein C